MCWDFYLRTVRAKLSSDDLCPVVRTLVTLPHSFFQIASVGIFCNWALLGSPGLSYALLFPNHPVALISKKPNWNSKFLMKKGVPDNFSN